jgi:hypothetical protein
MHLAFEVILTHHRVFDLGLQRGSEAFSQAMHRDLE